MNRWYALIPALGLAGCAVLPKPLQGDYLSSQPSPAAAPGSAVRWGGSVIAVEPLADSTCFQVLGRKLNSDGRPSSVRDESQGRFLVCHSGFYDPVIFSADREITVTGRVQGSETRKIGEYNYQLPKLAADAIYLWPVRYSFDQPYAEPSLYFFPGWYGFYGARIHYGGRHQHVPSSKN